MDELFKLARNLMGDTPLKIVVYMPDGREMAISQPPRHGPDFRSVRWPGQPKHFSFTANQAAVIRILWQAWESGSPEVSQEYLATEAGVESDLRHLFRGHPAWGTMIHPGESKGCFCLKTPE